MTKIIRDADKIREILTELQNNNQLRFVEIKSVKLRNPVHRSQQQLKNIFAIAFLDCSDKPMLLSSLMSNTVKDGEVVYLSHLWYNHCNVNPTLSDVTARVTNKGTKYCIDGHAFCNGVTQHHIFRNPEAAEKIIKGNLMASNPNDSYSIDKSVDIDTVTYPLYKSDNTLLKSNSTLQEFMDTHLNKDNQVKTINKLKANRDLRYGYYTNILNGLGSVLQLGLYNINDIENLIISDYYRAYSYDDLDEEAKNYKSEYEFIVGGCGSASSQIIDQLVRTTYLPSALLIDFDKVEKKNLRNQVYTLGHIGLSKTTALSNFMHRINESVKITTLDDRIENVFLEGYKCKYFISGFDNIDARLYVVDKIINKEFEVKYLIDARYNGLDASLYTVDCSNEDELKYYRDILIEDKIYFDAQKRYINLDSIEELRDFLQKEKVLSSDCSRFATVIGAGSGVNLCSCRGDRVINLTNNCGCDSCLKLWQSILKEAAENGNWKIPEIKATTDEGCTARNIIHIYKYVSSWVTSNIMSIENNDTKLFTHVDMTVEPLPKAIIIRK